MKRFFIIATFLNVTALAHTQSYSWAQNIHTPSRPHATAIRVDDIDNIYIATYTYNPNETVASYLEKMNEAQHPLWKLTLTGNLTIQDMELNSHQHAVIIGDYEGEAQIGTIMLSSPDQKSVFLAEIDKDGQILWAQSIQPLGPEENFTPVDMFIDHQDNIYFTSELGGLTGFCAFHKADAVGNLLHSEFNFNYENRTFSNILTDAHGNVYLSGTCGSLATFDDLMPPSSTAQYLHFMVKYDSNFTAQWLLTRPYITFDHNNVLTTDGQHFYWAFDEFSTLDDTVKILKIHTDGEVLVDFAAPVPASFLTSPYLAVDPEGQMFLMFNKFQNLYLYHLDSDFIETWRDTIRTSYSGFERDLNVHYAQGAYYVLAPFIGDTVSVGEHTVINGNTGIDIDLMAFKWVASTTVSTPPIVSAPKLILYPNPATDYVQIISHEAIPGAIFVYDIYGRRIEANVQYKAPGTAWIDTQSWHEGIYIIRTGNAAGPNLSVGKLLVLKGKI